ncbi:MAG: alpha/beta hydrolase [Geminicoccaceae bacterium]
MSRATIPTGAAARAQARLSVQLATRGIIDPQAIGWDDYLALAAAVDEEFGRHREEHALELACGPEVEIQLTAITVRTAYTIWPGPSERTVVCAGGIANTAHRFDFLGADLAGRFRTVALDWAGRGRSGWLPDVEDYGFPAYVNQLQALIEHLGTGPVTVIGSSIGGSAALCLAAARPDLVGAIVLNDSGAFMPWQRRQRRAMTVGRHYVFRQPADMFRRSGAAQKHDGPVEDAVLLHNSYHQTRWSEADGGRVYRHDLRALLAYRDMAREDLDLWSVWAQVACPVLMLHGLESDALTPETLDRMLEIRPFSCIRIPATGHTPALSCANQLALIASWLDDADQIGPLLTALPSTREPRYLFPARAP